MTDLPLFLSISIPSLLILISIILDQRGFDRIDARITSLEKQLARMVSR